MKNVLSGNSVSYFSLVSNTYIVSTYQTVCLYYVCLSICML